MSRVLWHTTMSVDGFIAGPDDSMDWAFEYPGGSPLGNEIRDSTGAILAGRRWYDLATERWEGRAGIYGGKWDGPVFVLSHHPPDVSDPGITFVSDGIANAVATARDAAGGKAVGLFGSNLSRQCIELGLLDEIVIHLAPVLLGDGVRLFGDPPSDQAKLERVDLADHDPMTDLRFRVLK